MQLSDYLSPLLIILAFSLYGVIHSLSASLSMKAWAARTFGSLGNRWYRFSYTVFAGLSFLPILGLLATLPDQSLYKLPPAWALLFNLGRLVSVVLLFLSASQTGLFQFVGLSQLSGVPENSTLNTNGLYRFVRHPIYTFTISFLLLNPSMSLNAASFALAVSLYCYVGALFEEKKLIVEFGEDYLNYRKRTPMLFPFRITKK